MFKSGGRWRNDKNKFKAVFKLQFHATQLEQVGGDALTISLVPADVGKPTVRSEKAAIQDGSCYWVNPVYEAVKLFQEPKSGKIQEKIYYFVMSTGSSKAGLVGEVSIDFASYAESSKPSSVSLPLKNTKCGAILHVSIQRLPENSDQRYPEQSENAITSSPCRSLKTQLRNSDADMNIHSNSTEVSIQRLQENIDQRDSEQRENANINSADRSLKTQQRNDDADMNIHSNSTEVSVQRLPENIGQRDAEQSGNAKTNSADRSLTQLRNGSIDVNNSNSTEDGTDKILHNAGLKGNPRASSGSDITMTSSESISGLNTPIEFLCPREVISGDKSQQALESMIEKLKTELVALSRVADVSELELLSLRKQFAKERKRGQDLSREVATLKEERDALKGKSEKRMDEARVEKKLELQGGNAFAFVEELRQELKYEKDLNANLRLQLQKMQESNAELILALRDLDIMVEQKDKELCNLSYLFERFQENMSKLKMGDDEEEKTLQEIVMESGNAKEPHLPDQKSMEAYGELQRCRIDEDDLEMQMEQLSLDYEILKQENNELKYKLEQSRVQEQLKMQYECSSPHDIVHELESRIENLESELEKQSNECSESLATVTKLERHIKDLEEEMEKQAQGFEADLKILIGAKVEQEQRAIRAEAGLKMMQWKNLGTAERLQDELRKVLVEVTFTLEETEKTNTKAETEASELQLQKSYIEELVSKAKEEIQSVSDLYEAKLNDMASEIERGIKHGEETHRVLSQEMLMLKAEIGKLETENFTLYDEVQRIESLEDELGQLKTSMEEKEMMLQRRNIERNDLERLIDSFGKDAEMLMEELNLMRGLKEEKELVVGRLETEINSLYDEVQRMESLKAELERMKKSLEDKEMMLQRGNTERNDLESAMNLLRKDAEMLTEELNLLRLLKDEKELVIGRLETENNRLYDVVQRIESLEDELEQMKTSMEEKEMMLQRGNMERTDLESMINLLRKDAEMLTEEVNLLRGLKDERELVIGRIERENNSLYDEVQRIESLNDELEQMKTSMEEKEMRIESLDDELEEKKKTMEGKEMRIESLDDELGQMKTSMEEKEMMLQRGNMERNDLESMISLLRKDAEMLTEELNLLRGVKDEKDLVIGNLQLELDTLKCKHKESVHSLFKDDYEEEERRNRVNGAFSNLEKQLINDNETYCMVVKDPEGISLNGSVPEEVENWSVMPMIRSCSEVSLVKDVEASIFSTLHKGYQEELLKEMELLTEKNTTMEGELKQMQERYSDISLKFCDVKDELNLLRGLKDEKELIIGRLETENNSLYDEVKLLESLKDELEQMKTSMEEKEMMLRRGNTERNDLESMIDLLKKDAEMLTEELNLLTRLKDETDLVIRRLEIENNSLYDEVQRIESLKDELEQMKKSMEENEMMLQRGNMERNDLESMISLLRKDAEMLTEELNLLRRLKDEKDLIIRRLEIENNRLYDEVQRIESLKDELEQMKKSMEENEMMLQRGNMERNDFESMISLLRKDAEMLTEELNLLRGLKDEKELVIGRLETENNSLNDEVKRLESLKDELEQMKTSMEEKEMMLRRGNMERTDFESMINLLRKDAEMLTEELNMLMGLKDDKDLVIGNLQLELDTLKSKHNESEHSLFKDDFEEEERRNRIFGAISNLDSETYCMVVKDPEGIVLNGSVPEEVKNWSVMPMIRSCSEVSLVKDLEASIFSTFHKGCQEELLKEMELLREKNTTMECELKQMHERYSDISLKFAEVEGERQRLVMTVNRKNRKKS